MKLISDSLYKEFTDAEEVYKRSLAGMQRQIDRAIYDRDVAREERDAARAENMRLHKEIESLKEDREMLRKICKASDDKRREILRRLGTVAN